MIAPKDESKSLVMDWLSQQGLADKASISSRGNTVIVKTTVAEAEALLEANYHTYSKSYTRPTSHARVLGTFLLPLRQQLVTGC